MAITRIVLSAAYGMGNLGDEAIAATAASDLLAAFPHARVTVLAWDTERFARSHPTLLADPRISVSPAFFVAAQLGRPMQALRILGSLWAVARCDLFVWGGGGLIRDRAYWLRAYLRGLRWALLWRRRVAVLSVGVERITVPGVRRMLAVLRRVHAVSVRDPESREHLLEVLPGLSVEVLSDGVLHYPAVSHAPPAERTVGIALCGRDGTRVVDDEFRAFADELAAILRRLHAKSPLRLLALPTEPRDVAFNAHLLSLLQEIPSSQVCHETVEAYLGGLSGCALFLGMRMHAVILSSRVTGLPWFGFSYSAKVAQLARHAKAEDYVAPLPMGSEAARAETALRDLLSGAMPPADFSAIERDSLRQREWLVGLSA